MPNVRVSVHTDTRSDNDGDPPDVEWGTRDTEHHSISGVTARISDEELTAYFYGSEGHSADLDVQHGDYVYAVIARYSSGDTFGNSYGHVHVMDVFATEQQACALRVALENPVDHRGRAVVECERTVNGKKYYIPWVGYFESLERIEIHVVRVGDEHNESI